MAQKYLLLENGIPDANTFRYVMLKITPAKIHEIFSEWMKSVIPELKCVAAIDGKQDKKGFLC